MKKIIVIILVLASINTYASGWMFVKEKKNNEYSWIDSTAFADSIYIDYTDILYIDTYSKDKDYVFARAKIYELAALKSFADFKEERKEIISKYCAVDQTTLIIYYMSQGMTQEEAIYNYLFIRKTDITNAANSYCERINREDVFIDMMMFLGEAQALTLTEQVSEMKNMLCEYAVLGTNYTNDRSGIMDYFENTGDFTTTGGLNQFTIEPMMIAIYGSEAAARAVLVQKIKFNIVENSI